MTLCTNELAGMCGGEEIVQKQNRWLTVFLNFWTISSSAMLVPASMLVVPAMLVLHASVV